MHQKNGFCFKIHSDSLCLFYWGTETIDIKNNKWAVLVYSCYFVVIVWVIFPLLTCWSRIIYFLYFLGVFNLLQLKFSF